MANRLSQKLREISNAAGFEITVRRIRRSRKNRRVIYFLHIGKAAGSQVKHAIEQINKHEPRIFMQSLPHDIFLKDLPEEAEYFFSIRDPITRFVSGFYSRKRMGRPKYDVPWTSSERSAFGDFEHANELAQSLFSGGKQGMRAIGAIKAIRHTAQDQIDWFALVGDIFSGRPPIWVLRQERFDEDFNTLVERAGLSFKPDLRRDDVGSHANDYSQVPPLSDKAKDNLRQWYAQDFAFYDAVQTWMAEQSTGR